MAHGEPPSTARRLCSPAWAAPPEAAVCPHGPASLTGAVPVLEGEGERWLGPGALEGASGARFAEGSPCGLPVLVVGVENRTCVVPPPGPVPPTT